MSEIELQQFLKVIGVVDSGGQAKWLVKSGDVLVNGEVELRRGRKLVVTDQVSIDGKHFKVADHLK